MYVKEEMSATYAGLGLSYRERRGKIAGPRYSEIQKKYVTDPDRENPETSIELLLALTPGTPGTL